MFFKILILVTVFNLNAGAQKHTADSLIQLLEKTLPDSNRVKLQLQLANELYFYKPAVSLQYSTAALQLSRQLKYTKGIAFSLSLSGEALRLTGDYPAALKMQFEALEVRQQMKDTLGEAGSLGFIGVALMELQEYRKALHYLLRANAIWQTQPSNPPGIFALTNTGRSYDFLKMPDSALYYLRLAQEKSKKLKHPQLESFIPTCIGIVYAGIEKKDSALQYFYLALMKSTHSNESINRGRIQQKIAEVHESLHQYDSSIYYARRAFADAQRTSQKLVLLETGGLLARLYRVASNPDSAFFYADFSAAMKDSLYGMEKFKQLQLLMLEEQQREQQTVKAQEQFRNRVKYTLLLSATGILVLFSFILLRNNRHKQKAKVKIENAYSGLKAAQQQLIQSEKMASLGELTAGIAHEIQNPLNFVNNFSEVSTELVDEMNAELDKGNNADAKLIATDLKQNLEKINHHGKRAGDIVKGMLQHSRSSTAVKEPTDINKLVDEYLRLAYHGLRAKDKTFNAILKTAYDESIGNINIIPQDIGRVILNLITNAFYATNEKAKLDFDIYAPTVTVKTSKISQANGVSKVEISVTDNGNGIPQKVLDKIFQPFFTTKPTGQGTGLGLSLSYDIVKAHGGELKVETKEGEGTEFMIHLPV